MSEEKTIEVKCLDCKVRFNREKKYFDSFEKYKVDHPHSARFFERKTTICDPCIKKRIESSLKRLPEIMKAIAGAV